MTLADDTLVRDLAERIDRVLPAMSLEPAAMLDAGRRHRRHRRVRGASVGALAVAAVALGAATGSLNPPDSTPPAAIAELAPGLVATAANDAKAVSRADGGAITLTDGVGHQYDAHFDPAQGAVFVTQDMAANRGESGGHTFQFSENASTEGSYGFQHSSRLVGDAVLVAGYVSEPGDVRLEWSGDGGTLTLDLPTFAVPGAAGRVYVLRIEGIATRGPGSGVTVVTSVGYEHRFDIDVASLQGQP